MSHAPPPPEDLTPEEYEKLKPLLQLADLGRTNKLAPKLQPAQQRRADLKARFLDGLRESGTISKAAAHAGISRRTAQRWQNEDEAFAAEVTKWLHEDQADEIHDTMFEIVKKGQTDAKFANAAVKAGEFLLKALDRDTYGDQLRTESTVTINQKVQIVQEVRDRIIAAQGAKLAQLRERTIDAEPTPPTLPTPPHD